MNRIDCNHAPPYAPCSFHGKSARYQWHERIDLPDRAWPGADRHSVPIWCSVDLRDGNQALAVPMDHERRMAMYRLLVDIGYKEIEVGFPAASQADFDFIRYIIEHDLVPDDVTIQVITQARRELIHRTFESIKGASRAIVHLYIPVSPLHRRVVFDTDRTAITDLAINATREICKGAARSRDTDIRYEYTPESFSQTELDFSLEISERVIDIWDPAPHHKMILNLPATVEVAPPNVFADRIEWMHRNLSRRDSIILSLHPHNDRGTAVAAAELGYQAGADRIEGCLFGNGERTGNVCLVTLGMNLFSTGVDPLIDFSDIDAIKRTVEYCNQLPVHDRHPWGGTLVYTAFSGGHQDAINKGLTAMKARAAQTVITMEQYPWEVPYLPIDPLDVGRNYKAIIRLNSQSGKGGVAYLMQAHHQLELPRRLQVEFSKRVQRYTDTDGSEVDATTLWRLFTCEYVALDEFVTVLRHTIRTDCANTAINACIRIGEQLYEVSGSGPSAIAAFVNALISIGYDIRLLEHATHPYQSDDDLTDVVYAEFAVQGRALWGVGIGDSVVTASLHAVTSVLNRAIREGYLTPAFMVGAHP
jgi:2-isopropylmalate synthase